MSVSVANVIFSLAARITDSTHKSSFIHTISSYKDWEHQITDVLLPPSKFALSVPVNWLY